MIKPVDYSTDSQCAYQQALDDFGISHLLTRLKTHSDADFDAAWMNLTQSELESIAAILIRELTTNLNGKAMAGYLNAMRHGSSDIPPSLVHLAFRRKPRVRVTRRNLVRCHKSQPPFEAKLISNTNHDLAYFVSF